MKEHIGEPVRTPAMRLMVAIVDREKGKTVTNVLRDEHERFHFACSAMGTASSEILDLLGLGEEEKTVVFCISLHYRVANLMDVLSDKLRLKEPGHGIAFSVPLSGVCNPLGKHFTEDNPHYQRGMSYLKRDTPEMSAEMREIKGRMLELNTELHELKERWVSLMEKEAAKTQGEINHSLIMAVVNQGNSDDLMDAAKAAGARGGTVIHARRMGAEDVTKFFGISVQEEREVVMILADKSSKKEIMQAINRSCGMQTEAKGMVFSLPVDSIAGIDL